MRAIKQITFDEALELARNGAKVYAIGTGKNIAIKNFSRLEIIDTLGDDYIYFIIEEANK